MSFIQQWMLAALPRVALPIIIHLINQRRYQTVRWGAMMFLLAANRMSRGYARLRQWLIMAFRMLAIAGLIFAVSRPLASGWLGLTAGGRPDTTIILFDRSPSMQQGSASGGGSKLETARRNLVATLKTLGSAHWVLIESTTNKPRELEGPEALEETPETEPASSPADLPAMLQAAHDYIQANNSGRTEIWICSDLRENDWSADSGRWETLREAFVGFPQGVRFNLLAYPQTAPENLSLRVTDVRRITTAEGAELLVSFKLTRDGDQEQPLSVPVQFEIDGAGSQLTVDLQGAQFELKDHRIPLERNRERGWGRVSIPADANPADNDFFFVFDQPVPRRSIVVADEPQAARPLALAASISPDPALVCSSEIVTPEQVATLDWEGLALVLWQAALPQGTDAQLVQDFVDRGGVVIFFPSRAAGSETFLGVHWNGWAQESPDQELVVESWRGDQDLLAHALSGTALPVGQLQVRRYCRLEGEVTPLATLRGGAPLLARVVSNRGGVYFCAATAAAGDSNLAVNGVVLYVLVHRALAEGAEVLGSTRQLVAGGPSDEGPAEWQRIAGVAGALSTEYPFHRGVYAANERLLAVNRPAAEDQPTLVSEHRLGELFRDLEFSRVDDQAGSLGSLIQEIWRVFLACMLLALIVEAVLCMPKPAPVPVPGVAT
ncbi:MAG: BatA domain-containing protein [Planctomycetales bacterium]